MIRIAGDDRKQMKNAGEFAALLTAMCWTVTALAFEASSRKVGSMVVNLFRLLAGFIFLSVFCWIYRGLLFPVDASGRTWFILAISGLIGFTFGDLCLFQAFVIIGARISMLLMALAPPITAVIGWIFLGETMTMKSLAGMALTLTGIAIVVLKRPPASDEDEPSKKKVRFSYPIWGILLGLGGAFGQATGLVLSKYGMHGYDPFASAQIRVIAGIGGFTLIYAFWNIWKTAYKALSNRVAMVQLSVGAFFGPFLGVSFSLLAVQLTSTGIASTIMAMVPVLIIPPSFLLFREKVTFKEILGALLAVSGVALFFL
jgi:drug/metabolite transporter (DMT)-like permease